MKVPIEMTLDEETAQRIKEAAERLATMDLGDDVMLAARGLCL